MNLPNALTVARMILIPVFVWLYAHGHPLGALIVYGTAAVTDALDGYLARRLGQITSFGKLMDPLADKLMQVSMLLCLCATGYVPCWIVISLLVRELYQVIGAAYLFRRRNMVVSAKMPGKISTCLFIAGILCVYPWHSILWLSQLGICLLVAALVFAVISSVCYTVTFGFRGNADC